MPKLRLSTLQDPIEFETPDGQTHAVKEITQDTIRRIAEIGASADGDNLGKVLDEQLAEFTGEDPSTFSAMALRQKIAIRQFVMDSFLDPLKTTRGPARNG